ncbi:MAG: GtrA family protein [Candidatus Kariarchaeaceae archaeon]
MEKSHRQKLIDKGEEPSKFLLVGLSGVGVNYLFLYLTVVLIGINEGLGVAIAIFISMTTNYILNRIWTFQSTNPVFLEYVKYLGSNMIGGFIQWGATILISNAFDKEFVPVIDTIIEIPFIFLASTIGIGFGFISNYIFAKFFVFENS